MSEQEPPRFALGRRWATPGAIETLRRRGIGPMGLLSRHVHGDWGDLGEEDKAENEFSVTHHLRILSAYGRPDDPDRLWVITEADRSATTILRPHEY